MTDATTTTTLAATSTDYSTLSERMSGCGVAYWAPKGTTVPTAYTKPSALDAAFLSLGEFGEDGWTEDTDVDSSSFNNINGDEILATAKKSRSFTLNCVEPFRPSLLGVVFGNGNVTKSDDGKHFAHVTVTGEDSAEGVMVVYEALTTGEAVMYVVPRAKPTDFDSVTHNGKTMLARSVTVSALSDGTRQYDMYHATSAEA